MVGTLENCMKVRTIVSTHDTLNIKHNNICYDFHIDDVIHRLTIKKLVHYKAGKSLGQALGLE